MSWSHRRHSDACKLVSPLICFCFIDCMFGCADVRKTAVKVKKHLLGLKQGENKIRGLARYNNPKTSFLAPDPTGRIMWYKYRACVAEHTKSELSLQNSCFSFPIRDNGVVPQTCFSSQAVSIHWKLERNLSKRKLQTQDKVLAGRPIKKYYKMPHDIMHR